MLDIHFEILFFHAQNAADQRRYPCQLAFGFLMQGQITRGGS